MMKRTFLLAWRYVLYNRAKTAILVVCLTLTMLLPLTAHLLIEHYGRSLMARARATPLVLGARGNRFDLVLKTLYFGDARLAPVHMAEVDAVRASGLGLPIPMHLRYTAGDQPVVGTTLDYFGFRGLTVQEGSLPLRLGQAALGATAAADLGLGPGDRLFSDQRSLYDITRTYPLRMHVCGVLAPSGTPDDRAVFVDVKTAWIIDGIAHGHQDVASVRDDRVVLDREEGHVVTSEGIVEYNEVTEDNVGTFHVHAERDELPISAILVLPADRKSATLLRARYNVSAVHRMLVPEEVIEELMSLVFRIKRFFDANFALITASTVLFLVLVTLLSHRLRRREMETMFRIGASRMTAVRLQAAELGIVLVISLAAAGAWSALAVLAAPQVVRWL